MGVKLVGSSKQNYQFRISSERRRKKKWKRIVALNGEKFGVWK